MVQIKYKPFIAFLCALLASCQHPSAVNVQVDEIFTGNAVLQRDVEVPVWGTADPGGSVKVEVGDVSAFAEVDEKGTWMVEVPPMRAGGPYEMHVIGEDTTTFRNVLFGDVWIASGQSNMAWPLKAEVNNYEEEIANASYPEIRLFTVARNRSAEPLKKMKTEGWKECSPETVGDFSAVAYFFGRNIHQELNVPVGLIHSSWGGTPAEAWTSEKSLVKMEAFRKVIEEDKSKAGDSAALSEEEKEASPPVSAYPHEPAVLFNAMVNPLIPYSIKGVIWYQGESNVGRARQYQTLFPLMIEDWREQFGQGKFPFLFVQLANFEPQGAPPDQWAKLREAQMMALDMDNTGMAVTIDIGDSDDIHPRNKQDVGYRLSLAALKVAYGKNNVYAGAVYDTMRVENDTAYIKFKGIGEGLMKMPDEELRGFIIAGSDREFVQAKAKIVEKDEVAVYSFEVKAPQAVRYGWSNNPDANLYNREGLPASPFRTDSWESTEDRMSER